ncbi:MAG: hypothetical protein J1E06_06200 [Acutalibacter sp.]|nr:hypothetical protein [Acutalibacter sp.]
MKGKKGIINRVLAALCFTMALILLLSGLGATLAKYIRQDANHGLATAAPFYFESEELAEEPLYHHLTEPAGGQLEIKFTLSNFIEETRYTGREIKYNYQVVDANGNTIEGKGGTGTLDGSGPNTAEISIAVDKSSFSGEIDGAKVDYVTVIASSLSPYAKTLSAEYGFTPRDPELQYSVEEQEGAVVLEIAGGNGSPVTVTWPSSLLTDPYNEILEDVSGSSVTFTPQPGNRYALTFLKESGGTYSKEDFTVTQE